MVKRKAGIRRSSLRAGPICAAALVVSAVACGRSIETDTFIDEAGGTGAGGTASGVVDSLGGATGVPVAFGGAGSVGGAGGASATNGFNWGGFGGVPFTGYCAGTSPKIYVLGQYLSPDVAYYEPSQVVNGSTIYGLYYQTSASVGFDLRVEVVVPATESTLGIHYTTSSTSPQATVSRTDESPMVPTRTQGTIYLDSDPTGTRDFTLGVCVEVNDPTSNLVGTRIFFPSPTATQYW